jgi:hypothetical protein
MCTHRCECYHGEGLPFKHAAQCMSMPAEVWQGRKDYRCAAVQIRAIAWPLHAAEQSSVALSLDRFSVKILRSSSRWSFLSFPAARVEPGGGFVPSFVKTRCFLSPPLLSAALILICARVGTASRCLVRSSAVPRTSLNNLDCKVGQRRWGWYKPSELIVAYYSDNLGRIFFERLLTRRAKPSSIGSLARTFQGFLPPPAVRFAAFVGMVRSSAAKWVPSATAETIPRLLPHCVWILSRSVMIAR